ncbi:glycosyltransferase family 4 protein [Devosia ginsengisoli]|uniref:glycosyltransferase family 4 protein n=1 Tax=Devosia ginsengisoli TaxID=400770 RepID=UPI0026F004AC|nr:glycosyltransferase family 4 protein [Devosia ginsengisoli]MCR6673596.1 glycosyltransferase family 4 protein [Devosia ginsengisoli]
MAASRRILVHDYSGHPFQVQLSRALARRGHEVLHVFSTNFQTPKGNLTRQPTDAGGFEVKGLSLGREFRKDTFVQRRQQEIEFGRLVAREIDAFWPDTVISSNAPLDTQKQIFRATRAGKARFIFWLQDIYSEAIGKIVPKKLPLLGHAIAALYRNLEFSILRQSDHVVSISDDFIPILAARGVDARKIAVIENWAPLDEIVPVARDNDWSARHLAEGLRAVYSGTLGYKHNPDLLLEAARAFPGKFYVFSEGRVADALRQRAADEGVHQLEVRPWVPFSDLPDMLSGADIFIAMIEADAGIYSVPSKILTYLCIGRPILASIPEGNLARKTLARAGAGIVVSPADPAAFIAALNRLATEPTTRDAMAEGGRHYAEQAFDIEKIADRFQALVTGPLSHQNIRGV